jgi:uncharacterized protein YciI
MPYPICAALLLAFTLAIPSPLVQDSPMEMMTYQLVLLKKGPNPPRASAADQQAMLTEHLALLAEQHRKGINVAYGPVVADADIRGIGVLTVATSDEAKALFAPDPFVKAGIMTPEVYRWMGPKGWFHAPASYDVSNQANLEPLIFGFLVRGPNTSQDKAAADAIQKGHLAYMDTLHKQGKLVMAGPLLDAGARRGVVVYRVKDMAEAMALAAEDPAVKAGRLTLEAYPWMTFKGILK